MLRQSARALSLMSLGAALTEGAVELACLTEAAASDTATLDFKYNTVLRRTNKWNDRILRVDSLTHIHYKLLLDLFFAFG